MIQFNLLPDVKLEFVKAQRLKHAVVSGSVIVTGVALVIFSLLLVAVYPVQGKVIKDNTKEIKKLNQQLVDTKDIDKILTIQGQLGALPGLHADKPAAIRVFNLARQFTPGNISLSNLKIDYVTNTIEISAVAKSLDATNTMVDTVKFMDYKADDSEGDKVFSNVVLSSFSAGKGDNSTFSIKASYDPIIFKNDKKIEFVVPNLRTTQSYTGAPASLFVTPTTDGN